MSLRYLNFVRSEIARILCPLESKWPKWTYSIFQDLYLATGTLGDEKISCALDVNAGTLSMNF